MDKITQEDLDLLMDILWWIKGYRAGDASGCPFLDKHMDALDKVKGVLQDKLNRPKDCEPAPVNRRY